MAESKLSKKAVKRLTKLADYMDSLPRKANKHFNMMHYFDDNKNGVELQDIKDVKKKHMLACGTSACAAGWATTVPAFKRKGFKLDEPWQTNELIQAFFKLDPDQEQALFGMDLSRTIKTPKQWAEHARRYIEENT